MTRSAGHDSALTNRSQCKRRGVELRWCHCEWAYGWPTGG